ncbi:MAG: hypothetical protein LPK03_09265 [Pontibacter sp.]|nr:hypothetical protein [Pontibacter sp.]
MKTSFMAFAFLALLSSTNASGEFDISSAKPVDLPVIERWECKEKFGTSTGVLVVAEVLEGRAEGRVHVAGVIYWAAFEVKGFDRRWDFVLRDDGNFSYAFIMEPNGDAKYYDFTRGDSVKPSNFMQCRQVVGN